jgi:hypothetical protein
MRARRYIDPLRCGDVWTSSDPRRLSAFTILGSYYNKKTHRREIFVKSLQTNRVRHIAFAAFFTTGPRGYTRLR